MTKHHTPGAAVAIIRCQQPDDSFLLLRRNHHPDDPWSGHFSFPGGRKDPDDFTLLDTCLRETYEETGIHLSKNSVDSTLAATYAGRRAKAPILVQPYLFILSQRPEINLDNNEIQSYCWLDTKNFLQKELHIEAEVLPDMHYPAYPLQDYYLWGFTYGLLLRLLDISS